MIVEFFTTKERLPFIQEKLGDKVVILAEDDFLEIQHVKIQITLETEIDALYLFHAGINYGLNHGLSLYR